MGAGHSHGHAHGTATETHRNRLFGVLAITVSIMVAEVIGGLISGSLALLADAGHAVSIAERSADPSEPSGPRHRASLTTGSPAGPRIRGAQSLAGQVCRSRFMTTSFAVGLSGQGDSGSA
jgi:hypothetical protein